VSPAPRIRRANASARSLRRRTARRLLTALSASILGGLVAVPAAGAASSWFLSNSPTGGAPTIDLGFGEPGDVALSGDWNGDGTDTPGVFRQRAGVAPLWVLSNNTTGDGPLLSFAWGEPTGDIPIVGDWNADGADTVGLFRGGTGAPQWYLATTNAAGGGNPSPVSYGNPGDAPIVGDWNGDGIDTLGVVRAGSGGPEWWLASANSNGGGAPALTTFTYGNSGDVPLAGDWNGDGTDTVGIFRREAGTARWSVAPANSPTGAGSTHDFLFGLPDDAPVVGDWNGDATDSPAIVRASVEYVPPAPSVTPQAVQANGQNASRLAELSVGYTSTRQRIRRMRFEATPTIAGKLVDEHGAAIGAADLVVLARRRQFHAATNPIGTVRTGPDGSFSYRLPSGPSRTVTFSYTAFAGDPKPSASASLGTLVSASLTAAIAPRSPRAGRPAKLDGRLRYLPRAGVQVTIQARDGRVWRPIGTVKTRARGRYTWRYRFKRSARGKTFALRARVDSPVYPFTPGHSRSIRVPVR
jgi:hypothetical protein